MSDSLEEIVIKWVALTLIAALVLLVTIPIICGLVIPAFGGINYEYSCGERTGVPYKLSTKGLFWRTVEGEMNLGGFINGDKGSTPNIWKYSVVDKDIAEKINSAAEQGRKITVIYTRPLIMGFSTGSSGSLVKSIKEVE